MSASPSIKVVKTMTYRGSARLWSNRYHFDNSKPADNTKWGTFSDAVVNAEKLIYQNTVGFQIVATYGYDAGSDVPVYSKTYTTNGSATLTTPVITPGDVAALLRFSTNDRTEKNHPLYLFNYFHNVTMSSAQAADELNNSQQALILAYGNTWIAGISDGSVTHHRCGPNGNLATGATVNDLLTHRDFPRG